MTGCLALSLSDKSLLLGLEMLGKLRDRSLVILFEFIPLSFSLFIESSFLLGNLAGDTVKLGIQTFNLLVLPLLLLCEDLKVELDISCVISLKSANIDLVLKLH